MASGNNLKQKMTQITSRQKVIIVVMVIVVLIIIWQIVGLLGIDSAPPPPPPPIQSKMDATKPNQTNVGGNVAQPPAGVENMPKPPGEEPQTMATLKQASIVNDPQFNRMQRMTEEKYVGKLNELEELRIQRQIAETNQAIAAAKLATVTAEKDISDLLTKPSPGSAAYASQFVKTSVDVTSVESSETPKPPPPPQELTPYKLISVSLLFNKWTAIVSLQDTLFSVSVGDTLPPDGAVVVNINKNSMTLRKDGKSRKISISASI